MADEQTTQTITPNAAKMMTQKLNRRATHLSDLHSKHGGKWSHDERGRYEVAIRQLEKLRVGYDGADSVKAQAAFDLAMQEIDKGIAGYETTEAIETADEIL